MNYESILSISYLDQTKGDFKKEATTARENRKASFSFRSRTTLIQVNTLFTSLTLMWSHIHLSLREMIDM